MTRYNPKLLPRNLRRIREALSITQADLARGTGLQPAAISHFETGTRSPSLKNLCALANALGCSLDGLLR